MSVREIRTALKVDFSKPAWEQPGLHVRFPLMRNETKQSSY